MIFYIDFRKGSYPRESFKLILKFIGLFMLTNIIAFITTPLVYFYWHWNTTYFISIFVATGILLIVWTIIKLTKLPNERQFRHGVE